MTTEYFEDKLSKLDVQNENLEKTLTSATDVIQKKSQHLDKIRSDAQSLRKLLAFLCHQEKQTREPPSKSIKYLQTALLNSLLQHSGVNDSIFKRISHLEAKNKEMRNQMVWLLRKLKDDANKIEDVKGNHQLLKQVIFDAEACKNLVLIQAPGRSIVLPKLMNVKQVKEKIQHMQAQKTDKKKASGALACQMRDLKSKAQRHYHEALINGVSAEIKEAATILALEKERTDLLQELDHVLKTSLGEMVGEYYNLEEKVLNLQQTKRNVQQAVDVVRSRSSREDFTAANNINKEDVDTILDGREATFDVDNVKKHYCTII